MKVKEVMTANPACCLTDTGLQEVAQMMIDNDCGEIPVVESMEEKRPIGVITDRDIVCRTVARGLNPLDLTVAADRSAAVVVLARAVRVDGLRGRGRRR